MASNYILFLRSIRYGVKPFLIRNEVINRNAHGRMNRQSNPWDPQPRLRVIYTAPSGKRIRKILGNSSWDDLVRYQDRDHDPDVFDTPLGRVKVYGDRKGKDAGVYTGLSASFTHTVTVELDG